MRQHGRALEPVADDALLTELRHVLTTYEKRMQDFRPVVDSAARDKVIFFRSLVAVMSGFSHDFTFISQRLAIRGVIEGAISRRLAGELLGVHQATIARWVKEFDTGEAFSILPPDVTDGETPEETRQWVKKEFDQLIDDDDD